MKAAGGSRPFLNAVRLRASQTRSPCSYLRGSALLCGCFLKGLTGSSLRGSSGYAGKDKSSPSGLLYEKRQLTVRRPEELRRKRSI
jgi:hypothetical protein